MHVRQVVAWHTCDLVCHDSSALSEADVDVSAGLVQPQSLLDSCSGSELALAASQVLAVFSASAAAASADRVVAAGSGSMLSLLLPPPEVFAAARRSSTGKLTGGDLSQAEHRSLLQWLRFEGTSAAAAFKSMSADRASSPAASKPPGAVSAKISTESCSLLLQPTGDFLSHQLLSSPNLLSQHPANPADGWRSVSSD